MILPKTQTWKTAAAAAIGLVSLGAAPLAQAQSYWGDYGGDEQRSVYRCDRDGDRCAWFRCEADGDDCRQVSGWTQRPRYSQQYRCDEDGDRCAWFRCEPDGDCRQVSGWAPRYDVRPQRQCDPDGDRCWWTR